MSRLIQIARSAVGLTEDDPRFQALCGPGEPSARARDLATLSTCALFLRGCVAFAMSGWSHSEIQIWTSGPRALSLPSAVDPRLWAPYVQGMAMANLVKVCDSIRVGYSTKDWREHIKPSNMVIIGQDGQEHVYLIETIHRHGWPDGSIELDAIEAGQLDKQGRQCVRRKKHEIKVAGLDESINRNGAITSNPVTWVLDPSRLLK